MTKHRFFFQATTKQPLIVTEGIWVFVSVASLKKHKG